VSGQQQWVSLQKTGLSPDLKNDLTVTELKQLIARHGKVTNAKKKDGLIEFLTKEAVPVPTLAEVLNNVPNDQQSGRKAARKRGFQLIRSQVTDEWNATEPESGVISRWSDDDRPAKSGKNSVNHDAPGS
jgi:hypothetical protein